MKFVGVSTPAYSFPMTSKPNLEAYRKPSADAPLTDIRHLEAAKSGRQRPPAFSVGKAKRRPFVDERYAPPGVGAYNLIKEANRPASRRMATSVDGIKLVKKFATPGVGKYDIAGDMTAAMSKTFGYRFTGAFESNDNPGPGHYDVDKSAIGKEQARLAEQYRRRQMVRERRSTTRRREAEVDKPSVYCLPDSFDELRKTTSKRGTFAFTDHKREARLRPAEEDGKSAISPGPGDYDVEIDHIRDAMQRGRGASVQGKLAEIRQTCHETPGPGTYKTPTSTNTRQTYSIGKAKKDLAYLLQGIAPGPGNYQMPVGKAAAISMTKSLRKVGTEDKSEYKNVPGPGTYNMRAKVGEGPKFTMAFKAKDNRLLTTSSLDDNIGPGAYSPAFTQTHSEAHGQTFARSQRPASRSRRFATPGVGDYSIEKEAGSTARTGVSFTTAARGLMPEENIEVFPEPGPGAYNLRHTIPQLQKFEQDRLDIHGWKITLA